MRGKLAELLAFGVLPRNIPAYAGKTEGSRSNCLLTREHPRVCGENIILTMRCFVFLGTSPRMRGKPPGSPNW